MGIGAFYQHRMSASYLCVCWVGGWVGGWVGVSSVSDSDMQIHMQQNPVELLHILPPITVLGAYLWKKTEALCALVERAIPRRPGECQ